jgi:ribosomal protein L11 methyltransferase
LQTCRRSNRNPIVAFDNDTWSVENAQENIATNHCTDITVNRLDAESSLTTELRRAPFTLILANVNRNVIDKILPTIHTHAPNASVLLSGILKYDSAWLHHLMSNLTYRIESLTAENEWLCAFIKKT